MLRLGRPCALRAWLPRSGCSAASTEGRLQVEEPGSTSTTTFGARRHLPPKGHGLLLLLLRPTRAAAEIAWPPSTGIRSYSTGARKDTSTSLGNDHIDPSQEDGKKPNKSQQLKKVFKEYGAVAVAFHVGISLMSLGMFYLAVSSGVDMTAILFKLGFDESLVQSKLAAGTSTFLLAYAVHKLFAPVRISITLVSVPFLVRYFRKIGFFKPPAANP
ncbi:protein FAM210B, mitochondrial [Anolis carolinensis]|uniref:Family with sequence similarity 210 member B n=1 Tax=Anolis carolinensis TaxID=28377 RepID=H9GMS5_ANOCA|nr:PREDICTED: protein FAM210B [Anolis carolinensis]|eukprot:XP_003223790.1 PREDICTED: protein FAM210B [Anolis carolinensis]